MTNTATFKSEANTLTLATTPVANLTYWEQAYGEQGMEYPISGDILAIIRSARSIGEPELAVMIVNNRHKEAN